MDKKSSKMNNLLLPDEEKIEDITVHIRIKQRTKKKKTTFIEGLENVVNIKKFVKHLSKQLACGGAETTDKDTGMTVIKFQGDHKDFIKKFLIDNEIVTSENIITHG